MKHKIVLILSVICFALFATSCEDEFNDTKRAGEKYLEQNLAKGEVELLLNDEIITRPVQTLSNGLQYAVYYDGDCSGDHCYLPTQDVSLMVNMTYKAYFIDGSVLAQGNRALVSYVNLPLGVREALRRMKTGSRWRIWLPASLAYGTQGLEDSPQIDPHTVLIYDIALFP
ncbi:MAG: FKBP-type peptidyl-prolyl cis-trans isomerase [Prevotellaceae bacterium]|jgi:FKBP-type peptidyl-prolyl cis-trans isomerase FklB|nr:FKBP-type peptidyl-prolyl cis-trans isomerase [Prevotellaceae bacterium]